MAFIVNPEDPFQELELQPEILFQMETGYMAAPGFFQNGDTNLRWGAQYVTRMLMETSGLVHDPFVPFLALNYYDRISSRYMLLRPQSFALFAISCTILAWKLRSNGVSVQQLLAASQPRFTDVRGLETLIEARHIEEMEFYVLCLLNWRTRPITPVCFMNFFLSLLGIDDPQQRRTLKEQVFGHQILYMHCDIRFTRFRPSIIAVVGIMAERPEDRHDDFWNPVRVCEFVNLEEMENCLNLLDMAREEEIAAAAVVPQNAPPPPQVPQNAAAAVVPPNAPPPQVPQHAAAAVVPQNAEPPQVPQNAPPPQVPQNAGAAVVPQNAPPPQVPQHAAAAVVPQNAEPPQVPQNAPPPQVPQNAPPPQVPQHAAAVVVPQNAEPPQVPQIDDPLQPRTPPQQE